jgi:hypothetical protein
MSKDQALINDNYRSPVWASHRDGGGVVLRPPRTIITLSADEPERVIAFVGGTQETPA